MLNQLVQCEIVSVYYNAAENVTEIHAEKKGKMLIHVVINLTDHYLTKKS